MPRLAPGTPAPDFDAPTQTGDSLRLSSLHGHRVALYFYPKDDTPGCTRQACSLRDSYAALQQAGIAVVGVSGDSAESHQRFADKYDLPFPLVADTDHAIAEQYGVWGEKTLYGRTSIGLTRTTFLIGPDGIIEDVIARPDTGAHADEVLKRFGS